MTPMKEKQIKITDNDIKITDNDIIKDLNRCANTDISFCKECTHRNFIYSDGSSCCIQLMKSALDLVNRQKEDIERLEKENNQFADIGKMYSEIKSEATTEFAERLKEGKWKFNKDGSGTCSECGITQKSVWDYDNWQNFCGHCGARMKGGEADA